MIQINVAGFEMAGRADDIQLKRATEVLVKSAGRDEAVAGLLGKGHSTVNRWYNRQNDKDFINLSDLRELEANAPEPLVTMALARLAGGVFVPLPQVGADSDTLAGMVMELAARVGAISRALLDARGDGHISAAEAAAMLELQHDLDGASAQLRLALRALLQEALA